MRIVKGTALYSSNFTVPRTPPTAVTGTELLLNFGSTGAPPTWYGDGSLTARTVTLSAGVTRVDEGNGLVAAAISNGALILNNPSNNLFDFGTGNFTVEFFVKPESLVGDGVIIDARTNVYVNNSFFVIKYGSTIQYSTNNDSGNIGPTATITAGWNHVAIVRSGGASRMFVNSLSAAEIPDTRNINAISTQVRVGAAYDVGTLNFNGRIAGLRVVKGSALYSGAAIVVPHSVLTAVAGTQALLNFGSTATPAISTWYMNTSPVAQTVVPNGTVTRYVSGGVIGLASSNTGYLTTGTTTFSSIGTGDFTVEFFMRPNPNGFYEYKRLISLNPVESSSAESLIIEANVSNGTISGGLYGDPAPTLNTAPVLTQGVWHHIAISRNSGVIRTYLDGVKVVQGTSTTALPSNWLFTIGGWRYFSGTSRLLDGIITGIRVVTSGLYTTDSIIVPTVVPTAITGTRLLLNFGSTAAPTVA
jgi:hypothetical protein